MDVIDSGADTAQLFLDMELRRQQTRGAAKQPTGFCYNCGEPVAPGLLYCDTECAADDEKRETVTRKQHARDSVLP